MKKLFRLALCLLLSAVFAVPMAACVNDGKREGEILFWLEEVGANPVQLDKYVEYFNENNPFGYTLKYELKTSVSSSLKEARTAGVGPDIVSFPRWETATSNNLIRDITSYVERDMDVSDFNSEAIKEVTYNNKYYAVPTDINAWGIWANMDLVNAYNETHPSTQIELPLETWDEWAETAKKLTDKKGSAFNQSSVMGFNSEGFRGQIFAMLQTAGVNCINSASAPPSVNMPEEETLAVLGFMYDMMYTHDVWGPTTNSMDLWTGGKFAMQFGSTDFKNDVDVYLSKKDAMNMVFMGMPARSATQGKVSGIIGGFSYAIPNISSVNASESWDVIKWMASDEAMLEYCKLLGVMPVKNTLLDDEFVTSNPTFSTLAEILSGYATRPLVKGYPTVEVNVFFSEIDKLLDSKPANKDAYLASMRTNMINGGNNIFNLAQG